jgi:alpha-D-xyloside xylohydrolase
MGVDVFKTDFGEYLPEDAVLSNGQSGKAMRNLYPHLYQQAVYEAMEDSPAVEDALLWARSGWIGSQQYPVHWSGDPYTSFESMAACLRGGLSLGLSGYPFWSCDIGGFRGEPTTELYVRWAQFGLLCTSHPRFHGTTPREPWHYGEEALEIVREYAKERYRLLPYIYSYAKVASERGLPVMRPLVLAFPDDVAVSDVQTQLLLGDHLLIAPVMNSDGVVDVYLPEGEWVDYWTGKSYPGNQTLHLDVELNMMPVFVEAGSVVPQGEPVQHVREDGSNKVTLLTTLRSEGPTNAAFEWYDEDQDQLRDVTASADGDHERVSLVVPDDRRELFEAEVKNLAAIPQTIVVNGEAIVRVDDNPTSGEWIVQDDGSILAVL